MEVIESQRGGQMVALDGFLYTKRKSYNDTIVWRCVQRDSCKGSLRTNGQVINPVVLTHHTHGANNNKIEVLKCRRRMKIRALGSLDNPNQILVNGNAQLNEGARAYLSSSETIKRDLRRTRAAHRPQEPASLQDLIIEGAWAQTHGDVPEQFVLHDSGVDSFERIIMFGKRSHLVKLMDSEKWCCDGTFSVAPALFTQLYVILGKVAGTFVPLVYVLLERKTQSIYEAMLNVLLTNNCIPQIIIIDFEISVQLATHAIFGMGVEVQYCYYHLTQSTWRHIQELGLTVLYREDDEFRLFCGMLDALAFLPPGEVHQGMALLRGVMPPEAEPLVTYFDENYVNGRLHRVDPPNGIGLGLRLRRQPPLFPVECWNMHQVTMDDEPRTNNNCEAG